MTCLRTDAVEGLSVQWTWGADSVVGGSGEILERATAEAGIVEMRRQFSIAA